MTTELAPAALADRAGRVFMQPWNLDHGEYIEHAFEQLRQSCLTQPPVAAALLRVLRMLMAHVQEEGRPEHVAPLQRQMRLLTSNDTDPADHSR